MSELYKNVEEVATDKIVPYTNNPKKHPDEQVDKIAGSIQEFGFTQPLVVTEDDTVVIGHGRLKAAKKLGLDSVPVIRRSDLSEAQVKAFRIADNRVAESDWEADSLAVELEQLDEMDFDLEDTGFDKEEIEDFKFFNEDFSRGGTGEEMEEIVEEFKTSEKSQGDSNYFFVEYYGENERFEKLKKLIKENGLWRDGNKQHDLDPEKFEEMVREYVNSN